MPLPPIGYGAAQESPLGDHRHDDPGEQRRDGEGNDHVVSIAGRDPYDRALSDLIGERSTRSEDFRVRWVAHNVRFHRMGVKRFHHPLVGDLTLAYEGLELPGDPGQTIFAYTGEPNSPSHDALNLLASWSSTPTQASAIHADENL